MSKRGVPLLIVAALLLAVFVFSRGSSSTPSVDYKEACGTAHVRAESPEDVRGIFLTLERSGVIEDVTPAPSDVRRHDAVMAMLSIHLDAPTYPIPSGFKGGVPVPPDYARLRELQRQLAAACE